ncbi:MAG TPA: M67 family metallopeptidase [Polyangia bacterium]|jgi:Predicted metal-dependent protease of the PAD1/JAB1 superfamily|nr:M67 family metallopeptidase [Polyangia bacterium]
MSGITLPRWIYQALLAQARAVAPVEACAILAGRERSVQAFFPMTNTEASADRFMMDPAEQFAVVRAVRAAGQEMLAIHHSHPATPAWPSAEDICRAVTPGVLYTILSLADPASPDVRGFCIEGGAVAEVAVSVFADTASA